MGLVMFVAAGRVCVPSIGDRLDFPGIEVWIKYRLMSVIDGGGVAGRDPSGPRCPLARSYCRKLTRLGGVRALRGWEKLMRFTRMGSPRPTLHLRILRQWLMIGCK